MVTSTLAWLFCELNSSCYSYSFWNDVLHLLVHFYTCNCGLIVSILDFTFFSGPQSYEEPRERGPNLGKGLERITRRRQGKLPLVIPEGKLRPEAPLLAANFATECNIIVRHHMPVFKHWKDYMDPDGHVRDGIFRNFVGKVGVSTKSRPFCLKWLSTCQFCAIVSIMCNHDTYTCFFIGLEQVSDGRWCCAS